MMASIFVSFDPLISSTYSVSSWLLLAPIILVVFSLGLSFWVYPPTTEIFMTALMGVLVPNWMETTSAKLKGFIHILMGVFVLILSLNFISLFPYVLSYTAHLSFSATLAIPLWMGILTSGWAKRPMVASASLVPYGAPIALGPFLFLLEAISVMIRPVSLSLRLAVNLSAGHCLLSLISQLLVALLLSSSVMLIPALFIHVGYFLLEVGISFIQAYIFTTLLALYSNDHPS
nr:ATPase F0 subunit 6 [Armandia sp. GK-2021]